MQFVLAHDREAVWVPGRKGGGSRARVTDHEELAKSVVVGLAVHVICDRKPRGGAALQLWRAMRGQAQQKRLQWMDAPAEPEIAGMPFRLRLAS